MGHLAFGTFDGLQRHIAVGPADRGSLDQSSGERFSYGTPHHELARVARDGSHHFASLGVGWGSVSVP
jgi:hypothetical protein